MNYNIGCSYGGDCMLNLIPDFLKFPSYLTWMHVLWIVCDLAESWSWRSIKPQKQSGRRLLGEQLELFFPETTESPTVTSADLVESLKMFDFETFCH